MCAKKEKESVSHECKKGKRIVRAKKAKRSMPHARKNIARSICLTCTGKGIRRTDRATFLVIVKKGTKDMYFFAKKTGMLQSMICSSKKSKYFYVKPSRPN